MIRSRRKKPRPGRLVGSDLEALRQECYHRDGARCVICSKLVRTYLPPEHDDSYHMAHKRGKRMWGDSLEQVQTECGKCHRAYHLCGPSRTKIVPSKSGSGEGAE